ncbi:SGNH/GDSL hydrolase family protein [uncultured Ruminococcus sp.]|uniref:SGNH/GDSL hydrolase family protein n=2 Tax=uncultured Ruminococcus sp. TaxID=165186 RepID=UPI002673FDDD|nr:SGNH/GDSL hydrolase family protein [uncultured Ruminococcus sp.]
MMKQAKFLSLTAACVLSLTSVMGGLQVSAAQQSAPVSSDVKIMALGDSITDGYWTGGGYRKYLYHELEEMGYSNIDMVGPKGSNSESFQYQGQTVAYDGNYAGYSGYAIQYITGTETRQGILETINSNYGNGNMIETYDPDVVLLQIGTNDILSNYNDGITDRLENLVDTILADMDGENDMLYVSTIPNINIAERYDWLWAYGMYYPNDPAAFTAKVQGCIDSYNASIQTLVAKKQAEGAKISFADIHSVIDETTDMHDGVHPNETGYEKMGNYWANLLNSTYLNGNTDPKPVTTTTTQQTTASTTTTTKATTKATSAATTQATTAKPTETTTSATTAATTTTKATTKTTAASDGSDIVLTDVKIGETYDLTPYQNAGISSVSFVFKNVPQYGMNGCASFGNWNLSKNYTTNDLAGNTLTVDLDKFYNSMILYKWYGDTDLDSVILHCGSSAVTTATTKATTTTTTTKPTTTTTKATTTTTTTKPTTTTTKATTTTTTTKPTTTTTKATTTTTTTKPTTTTTKATTTTTTTKPTTTTTKATTTTTKATTTTTKATTSSESSKTAVLTDVSFGKSYSLKKYDYKSITKIQVTFGDNVGYGFNGALVLGNWAEQKSYHSNDMKSDNTITFDVKNPQDCLTLYRYWGEVDLKSVTLYFD